MTVPSAGWEDVYEACGVDRPGEGVGETTETTNTENTETTGESAPNPNIRQSVCGDMDFELPAVEAHPNEHPRFDVRVVVDTDARQGRLDVLVSLSEEECQAIYDQSGNGHSYPDDVREEVLRVLGLAEAP